MRGLALALAVLCVGFRPVPKESGKALGVTRGKPFSSGVVFVNGKYVLPPYVVERWGTGLRINGVPVSGQVIDWNEFLKTQDGVKSVVVTSAPPEQVAQAADAETAAVTVAASVDSLDDLFDDDALAKEPVREKSVPPSARPEAARQKPRTTYGLTGEFVPNDASKALVKRINASRTEIDRLLRTGGFACFGDGYSMVAGDKRSLMKLLEVLPGLQETSSALAEFQSGVRRAGLVFLNEALCADLYRNRADWRKLKTRYNRLNLSRKWDNVVEGASDPLF